VVAADLSVVGAPMKPSNRASMKSSNLPDDEAIGLAMLLGCEFFKSSFGDAWFVNDSDDNLHPLELHRKKQLADVWWWTSKGDLARDFIAWHLEQKQHAA
jgi:hypothetical protein